MTRNRFRVTLPARRLSFALAVSTMSLLGACNRLTHPPIVARPALPVAPAEFGKPIPAPPAKSGESVKTFALKNRAALHHANRRLENDAAFYQDVTDQFSKQPEPRCMFFEWWCE